MSGAQSPFTRPFESHGVITNRSDKEGAQFVHAFFDRFENVSPRFVSRVPSQIVAFIVFNVVVILFSEGIALERRMHHDSGDPILRMRWIGMVIALVVGALYAGGFVGAKVYMIDSILYNKQHFANVFWLREYLKAMGM